MTVFYAISALGHVSGLFDRFLRNMLTQMIYLLYLYFIIIWTSFLCMGYNLYITEGRNQGSDAGPWLLVTVQLISRLVADDSQQPVSLIG